jgi:hypothetical protein
MDRVLNKRPTQGMRLLGLRGVGKTVLLNQQVLYSLDLQASAGHKVRQAASVLRIFVAAFKVKIGDIEIGIDAAPGDADTGNLEQDLPDSLVAVCEAANERRATCRSFLRARPSSTNS